MNESASAPPAANDPLLEGLNPAQREAVVHGDGPLLVLAGAGSGKTRVITHRIAWLIERRNVAPWHIIAVTFTNKAAAEMRERLQKLLGPAGAEVHVSTFHSAGAVILRREAERVGLDRNFVIYDDSDQLEVIKRAMKEAGLDDRVNARTIRHRIDHAKNHGQLPQDVTVVPFDMVGQAVKKAYAQYERLMRAANAVDFGDLLLKFVGLLKLDAEVLDKYRRRFQHVLVDEFQDTNPVQYQLLQLLCPRNRANLCVVGDDDQSIYRWRGADISNILSFERDFPGAHTVKLEQNYRSDAGILEAAYAVIRKNPRRKEKKLWTDRERGLPLGLLLAHDERGEGQEVARAIKRLAADGVPYSEMAVFFRINAQSRVVEEALRLATVPYHIVRGRAFYDRAEIKDAAAYLRLAVNPKSDADLVRVINTPARGIGDTTVGRLTAFAQQKGVSLYEALGSIEESGEIAAAAQKTLKSFRAVVDRLVRDATSAPDAKTAVSATLEITGLLASHVAEGTDEAADRAENLREFEGAAMEFDRLRAEQAQAPAPATPEDAERAPLALPQTALQAFLEQISLIGDADGGGNQGRVSLMSMHAAKGLEFDAVFLTGMEEGVFPHHRALDPGADPEEMAEERRLAYVGITRARRRLFFSLARQRSLFGELRFNAPSRFLSDIPRELFGNAPVANAAAAPSLPTREIPQGEYVELDGDDGFEPATDEFDQRPSFERRPPPKKAPVLPTVRRTGMTAALIGQRVRHAQFGDGLVTEVGEGPDPKVTVRFPGVGEKRIVLRFLTPVGPES